jgi:hypothetical protein
MSSRSNPGRVYNRRVTRHIERLLPERSLSRNDFTFSGETIIDRENNPGKPPGGQCTIKAYIGEDGQLTVLEKSRLRSKEGELLWACWNRIRRTHGVDAPALSPFEYHVQTQILSRGERKRDETIISLGELESMPVYGGREAQAAVLLAERLAVEKAVAPGERSDICCSLHAMPSLPRVVDRGDVIRLSWKEMDALLGPDSEMIAASVDVEPVADEEREEAVEKGVRLLADDEISSEKAAERRKKGRERAKERRKQKRREHRESGKRQDHADGVSEELPDDVSPEEAEKKLRRMVEDIYEMRDDIY